MNMYELLRKFGEDALSEECRTVFEREYGIVDPQIMVFHRKNYSNKWQWVLLFKDVDWGFERYDIPRRTVAWRKSLLREKLVSFVRDLLDGIYSNRPGLRTQVNMLLGIRGFDVGRILSDD